MTPQGSNHQDLGYEILQHKYGRFYFPKWLEKYLLSHIFFYNVKLPFLHQIVGFFFTPLNGGWPCDYFD